MMVVLLIVTFLLTGICGYWITDRVDRFLNERVHEEVEEEDEPEQR